VTADEPPSISAEDAVRYVFDSCRFFGASLVTAHRVAALVAEECERIEAERGK
jgi:hypothetical protein